MSLGRRGKTIFFSTHILADVESIGLATGAGMLLHGRMVRNGTMGQLLDGSIRSVELRATGLTDAAVEAVRRLSSASSKGPDGWLFSFSDLETANRAAAHAVEAGGRIVSLVPQRENLEQTFVRLARAEAPPGPGSAMGT